MTDLNWFQAQAVALLGWPIRRAGWQRWLVYRSHCWCRVDGAGVDERWNVPVNTDMTRAEYLAKDWTTDLWEGGTRPACSLPGDPPQDVVDAASGSWGPLSECGLPVVDTSSPLPDDDGGLGGLSLDYVSIERRSAASPLPAGIVLGVGGDGAVGYTAFPTGYTGAVGVLISFLDRGLLPARCYVWLRRGAKPTGSMAEPFVFEADKISALTGATGPVLAAGGDSGFARRSFSAGNVFLAESESARTPAAAGIPPTAFAAIRQAPGDVLWARIDAITEDGTHHTLYRSVTALGWASPAVAFAVTVPDADSTHMVRDPGPDGIMGTIDDDPDGDPGVAGGTPTGDELMMPEACWLTWPGTISVTIDLTVTGGKPSPSTGTLTLRVDGSVVATWSTRTASHTIPAYATSPGSTITYSATWEQPEDEYGPVVSFTSATGGTTLAPAC